MAYDIEVSAQIKDFLQDRVGFSEKKMFGGICFLQSGNMACGVSGEDLIVRVGANAYDELMQEEDTSLFYPNKRGPMRGWIVVSPMGYQGKNLIKWIERGWTFASSLPPK